MLSSKEIVCKQIICFCSNAKALQTFNYLAMTLGVEGFTEIDEDCYLYQYLLVSRPEVT